MTASILIDGRPAQGRPRGMGIYTLRLLPALLPLSTSFTLQVALDRRAGADPWPELKGVEKVWGQGGNPILWEQSTLPRLAAQRGVSLLHCTANSSPWNSTVPQVVTIHDALFLRGMREGTAVWWHPRQLVAYGYYRWGVRRGACRARRVITDSEHSRQNLENALGLKPDRLRVIPLAAPHIVSPLPDAEFRKILADYGLTQPYLLGLGAIDKRKNTANLVRAFARLPRSAAQVLVLAGFEKVRYSSVPSLIDHLGIADRVKVLDYVPEKDLTALFQGAAVFIYPTLAEGFGLPILQAFMLGVPVITSRTGAVPEVAGEAVCYADPLDPIMISKDILSVLVDSAEAHRLAMAGYLQAKKFTWIETAKRTLQVYGEALAET